MHLLQAGGEQGWWWGTTNSVVELVALSKARALGAC